MLFATREIAIPLAGAVDILRQFFSTEFMPHGHCYFWKPALVWLHVASDVAITVAYYSIPLMLLYFVRKKRDVPFHGIFLMFGAFILACGTTHALEVWTLWVPTYWVSGAVKAATAAISLATAVALVPLIPQALALRSPAELEEANRELEREIAERKRTEVELAESRDRALELARLKAAFLANMSHEIRTPLNIILGYAELIHDRLEAAGDRGQAPALDGMRDAGKRLMTTIQGILDLSRIETGGFDVLVKPVHVAAAVQRACDEMQPVAAAKQLRVACEIEDDDPVVLVDEYCLCQALGHLLDNAVKFTARGEVTVRLHRDDEGLLCLTVADTGVGISREFLPRVFEPFSQEESGYTRSFEGAGLGLTLTKKYLELNDVALAVDSSKGRGSRFTARFPRARELGAIPAEAPPRHAHA